MKATLVSRQNSVPLSTSEPEDTSRSACFIMGPRDTSRGCGGWISRGMREDRTFTVQV